LRPAPEWTISDYHDAVMNLVNMHDRFWGLAEDLTIYPWLARPLDADYFDTIVAAVDSLQTLVMEERLPLLNTIEHLKLFGRLTQSSDEIIAPLLTETATLIHGDYWPGNIARPIDGRQIVFDWQMAGIGPAILDLVSFIQAVRMKLDPAMPIEDMIRLYRSKCEELSSPGWDDERFNYLWDHAIMWLFVANWIGKLATMPTENYNSIHEQFSHVWIKPLSEAVERRL
jgi:hypothetical protein